MPTFRHIFPAAASALLAVCAAISPALPTRARQATPAPSQPTYYRDIQPIVLERCSGCHAPGQAAPFALASYQDLKKRARQVAEVTGTRFMPPWKPAATPQLCDSRALTDEQILLFQKWADAGAPAGQPVKSASRPSPPQDAQAESALGAPDIVLQPSEPFHLDADGPDLYRCYVLPTRFGGDRYLSAIAVEPSNPRIADHALVFLDTYGQARRHDEEDPGPGYTVTQNRTGLLPSALIGAWGLSSMPHAWPKGTGIRLPENADIVLQMHYKRTGKPETDRPKLLLYFAKAPVDKIVRVAPILTPRLRIPAGQANFSASGIRPVAKDITVYGVLPYMRRLGRVITVDTIGADLKKENLLTIPSWDFMWIDQYRYAQPVHVPQGDLLTVTGLYDNSENNPFNPNSPPQVVTWGEQPEDEMGVAFVFYTTDDEHLADGPSKPGIPDLGPEDAAERSRILLTLFDTNRDHRLEPSERAAMNKALGLPNVKPGRMGGM